jgi:protein phosphatase
MGYYVDYIVLCEKGKLRSKNQDNFWCANTFLENKNEGLAKPIINSINIVTHPVFAVFDGMGGENHGETAAYLAADIFNSHAMQKTRMDSPNALSSTCEKMNQKICSYAKSNHAGRMGATVAILAFNTRESHICNLGDSKIFRHNKGKMTQLTHDHAMLLNSEREPVLTQHLGIPQAEFAIEPYTTISEYRNGDKFLLCSDGLTNMVALEDIEAILSAQKDISVSANMLMDAALTNGGTDNITIILCHIRKKWLPNPMILRKAGVQNGN